MENQKYQINNCQIILMLNLIFILIPTWLFYYYNIIIVMCVKVYQCCLRFYEFTIGIYFVFHFISRWNNVVISWIVQRHGYFHCEGSMELEKEGLVLYHAKIVLGQESNTCLLSKTKKNKSDLLNNRQLSIFFILFVTKH